MQSVLLLGLMGVSVGLVTVAMTISIYNSATKPKKDLVDIHYYDN